MDDQTGDWFTGGSNFHFPFRSLGRNNCACIPNLAAGFDVEGAVGEDQLNLFPCLGGLNQHPIPQDGNQLGLSREGGIRVVTNAIFRQFALGLQVAQDVGVKLRVFTIHVAKSLPLAGCKSVGFHRVEKAFFVDGQPVFFENIAGNLQRKAEGGVEGEGGFAIQLALTVRFQARHLNF